MAKKEQSTRGLLTDKLGTFRPDDPTVPTRALAAIRPRTLYTVSMNSIEKAQLLRVAAASDLGSVQQAFTSRTDVVTAHQRLMVAYAESDAVRREHGVEPSAEDLAKRPTFNITSQNAAIEIAEGHLTETRHRLGEAVPDAALAEKILTERERLGIKGARRLAVIPGAALGIAAMAGAIYVGNEFIATDTQQTQTVQVSRQVDAYQQAGAVNHLASGTAESPQESAANIAQDRKAVKPLLRFFYDNQGKITRVEVTGEASPETSNSQQNLQQTSQIDQAVADQRGVDGKKAFIAEAHAQQVPLQATKIATTGVDEVLKGKSLVTLSNDLKELKKKHPDLTIGQVIAIYNGPNSATLPAGVISDLNQSFAKQRGADFKVFGTIEKKSFRENLVYKWEQLKVDGIPLEYGTALFGIAAGLLSQGIFMNPIVGRLARSRAKRKLRE